MPTPRYYYMDETAKVIKHFSEKLEEPEEGFVFCGLSELPVKGAAGYYAKNQPGFTLTDGDPPQPEESETEDEPIEGSVVPEAGEQSSHTE